jgi:hypothetical protein
MADDQKPKKEKRSIGDKGELLRVFEGCSDPEGFAIIVGVIIAVLLGWLLVELVIPAVLVGCYVVLVAALRRVANDRHDCEGNLPRALLWGALWASVYTLPLAGLVWLVHLVVPT